ncbi:uncharacterized protein LOC114531428 [Dendronephthya gigantea]|uniref:uncharacterized protein LOC114531428 n=1 Tax=Dendronephthya gigantea TaxID=151771 RepID=UPI00106C6FFE|nr:uncharacterized protein LOC114531428 [Dendronephthya gigantea]
MPNTVAATNFLIKLNDLHPNLSFTMELPVDNKILFVGMEIRRDGSKIETQKVVNNILNNESRSGDTPDEISIVRISLRFNDQTAANAVRKQMVDLSRKVGVRIQPVFTSRKLEQQLKPREVKAPIVNQQCVVYKFQCDLCDVDYIDYTAQHLHQRIAEHKSSTIGKHFYEAHGSKDLLNASHFEVLRKCQNKFDCLIYEMLYIKECHPTLNIQSDSIRAKLFV